jgi:hypothetical protein
MALMSIPWNQASWLALGKKEEDTLGDECAYSFDDLFRAATGRDMSVQERISLEAASREERNRQVREWVAETSAEFRCEERRGTDGLVYTAFWAAEERLGDSPR